MQAEEVFMFVFTLSIVAGVIIILMGLRQRSAQLEMRHRERMAMIERGQIPLNDPIDGGYRRVNRAAAASSTSLSIGILVVGFGLALAFVIGIAGDSPEIGVGIGGAIAVLGGAFIVRSMVLGGRIQERPAVRTETPNEPPSQTDAHL